MPRKTASSNNASSVCGKSDSFKIVTLDAKIEDIPITLEEHSHFLRYVTPKFKATATVCVPSLAAGQNWQVGWIQACIHMKFFNMYKNGYSSWEFPEMISGEQKMVNDSDGHFPWYGINDEVATIKGPTTDGQVVRVSMEDNFFPRISWSTPPDYEGKFANKEKPSLRRSERRQGFYSWLVARNLVTNTFYVLKTVYWEMTIEVDVDASKQLGERAKIVNHPRQKQPQVLTENMEMTLEALSPPNCNGCQVLFYRSYDAKDNWAVKPPVSGKTIEQLRAVYPLLQTKKKRASATSGERNDDSYFKMPKILKNVGKG